MSDEEEEIQEITEMGTIDLRQLARQLRISGYKSMSRSQLLQAIANILEEE